MRQPGHFTSAELSSTSSVMALSLFSVRSRGRAAPSPTHSPTQLSQMLQ